MFKQAEPEKQKLHDTKVNDLYLKLKQVEERLYRDSQDWSKVFTSTIYKKAELDWRQVRNTCPQCGSEHVAVENHDAMWHDGDIVCQDCRTYVRMYDAG